MLRRVVVVGLLAVASLVGSVAQAATPPSTWVDVDTVPRGADVAVAWMDRADGSIHAGGAVIPTGLGQQAGGFRTVAGGFLVWSDRHLFHVSTAGVRTDLGAVERWVVRTGRYAGSQFVVERRVANGYRLEVRRSSDLSLLRGRTFSTYFLELDFHDGLVWTRTGRWNVNTGVFAPVAKFAGSAPESIEARVNAFARRQSDGSLRIAPLSGTPWAAWRARAGAHVAGWSPDGRFVVLAFVNADEPFTSLLEVRRLTTGAHVAYFSGTFTSGVKWEDAGHFLVAAGKAGLAPEGVTSAPPYAVFRLGAGGGVRRASEFGQDGSGPPIRVVSERS